MQPIQPMSVPLPPMAAHAPRGVISGSGGGPSFQELLSLSIEQLGAMQHQAAGANGIQSGMQVGTRLIAAYDEIKNLRI